MEMPSFLDGGRFQLLLFGGKGGVGKTTCAAAAGLYLAQRFSDSGFLLVSTDPAHSVADSLAGFRPPNNLEVLELDAQKCLAAFKEKHGARLREIASRGTFLDDEDISRFLGLSLPGLDELMAFLQISDWVQGCAYRCLLVDTAPTGHTLRLLETPELLRKWLGALDSLLCKHRYMRGTFSRSQAPDELDLFLEELGAGVERMESLLRDPVRCQFVPVTVAETLSIRETISLLRETERLHLPVTDIVVNRLYPESPCRTCGEVYEGQARELAMLFRHPDLSRYAAWGVPLYPAEVRGREALQSFWNGLARFTKPPVLRQPSPPLPPRVETAAAPPSPETTLLLFGGKGGVGKTTLACATAVWLANENTTRRILLFSTDPAHSLSDCLNLPVGPEPTVVHSGLAAVEIDPEAEFLVLKQEYAADLEQFLEALASNLDLVFDRQVMEKILDLAPPGLDEIMALSKVLELLAHRSYDVFVLDSASTGHLIRLLELPELIDQWLKVFFEVLLKYRRIFRLPKFSQRLVELSRNLKRLKKLLNDPVCSHLCVVTIPTEMAFEETKDLLAACRRIGIDAPSIFLNLVTPPSDCGFCSTIRRREALVRTRFEKAFPDRAQAVIYRQGELRGVAQLEQLAQAMYFPARKEWPTYA